MPRYRRDRAPGDFWEKLNQRPVVRHGLPRDAKHALEKALPDANLDYKIVRRKAGLGSLGQQRFVAIAEWEGGCIAREAKAMVPSACMWLDGHTSGRNLYYERAIASAVRAHDPFQKIIGRWIIRRLSPIRIQSRSRAYQRCATKRPFFMRWALKRPTYIWEAGG